MNKNMLLRIFAFVIGSVILFIVLFSPELKRAIKNFEVKKELDKVEEKHIKVDVDHRESVRIKCGIDINERMTVAWEKIDNCIAEASRSTDQCSAWCRSEGF